MLQALLSSTKSVELKRLVRQWRYRGKGCKEQSGYEESDIVLVRKRPSSSEQDRRVRCLEARTLRTWCRWAAEKVTSQRNRRSTSARRSLATAKGEYRCFSAVRKKRFAQQEDKADRHTAGDPEMGKTEFLGERGTSVLSMRCLLLSRR